jgi:hypothetical protein
VEEIKELGGLETISKKLCTDTKDGIALEEVKANFVERSA